MGQIDFTKEEMVVIMEAALLGLSDTNYCDTLADQMDIDDIELNRIAMKLKDYMGE
jgi:hypothetical protein